MPPRVLVVDDEEALCSVFKDVLEMEGYEVCVCHDAATAREMLASSRFDVAMIDIFLSNEPAGLTLGQEVLSNCSETSLVFMTGYAEEDDIRAGYVSGASACIRKPFNIDDVVRVVGLALDERRASSSQSMMI